MTFTAGNILLIGSILLFISILVGKTGYRFGVPALLLFLVVGMLFGSDGIGFQFHNTKEAQFIGMVALSIILFSGGMDTKFREIKPILAPGIVLSTVGVLLTAFFTGMFIWWLSGMSWTNIYLPVTTSLLLAATMSSTDSASVFAILRSQRPDGVYADDCADTIYRIVGYGNRFNPEFLRHPVCSGRSGGIYPWETRYPDIEQD